jgi:hypothetical protein
MRSSKWEPTYGISALAPHKQDTDKLRKLERTGVAKSLVLWGDKYDEVTISRYITNLINFGVTIGILGSQKLTGARRSMFLNECMNVILEFILDEPTTSSTKRADYWFSTIPEPDRDELRAEYDNNDAPS